jgi:hypothetical protein
LKNKRLKWRRPTIWCKQKLTSNNSQTVFRPKKKREKIYPWKWKLLVKKRASGHAGRSYTYVGQAGDETSVANTSERLTLSVYEAAIFKMLSDLPRSIAVHILLHRQDKIRWTFYIIFKSATMKRPNGGERKRRRACAWLCVARHFGTLCHDSYGILRKDVPAQKASLGRKIVTERSGHWGVWVEEENELKLRTQHPETNKLPTRRHQ